MIITSCILSGFFSSSKIYCYGSFYHCANFSIALGQNLREDKLIRGVAPWKQTLLKVYIKPIVAFCHRGQQPK